jgi:hypothetical protein
VPAPPSEDLGRTYERPQLVLKEGLPFLEYEERPVGPSRKIRERPDGQRIDTPDDERVAHCGYYCRGRGTCRYDAKSLARPRTNLRARGVLGQRPKLTEERSAVTKWIGSPRLLRIERLAGSGWLERSDRARGCGHELCRHAHDDWYPDARRQLERVGKGAREIFATRRLEAGDFGCTREESRVALDLRVKATRIISDHENERPSYSMRRSTREHVETCVHSDLLHEDSGTPTRTGNPEGELQRRRLVVDPAGIARGDEHLEHRCQRPSGYADDLVEACLPQRAC